MQISAVKLSQNRTGGDILILPYFEGKAPLYAGEGKELFSFKLIPSGDFKGKNEEQLFVYDGKVKEKRVLLVGLGKEKELTKERVRRCYAATTTLARGKSLGSISVVLPRSDHISGEMIVEALVEGVSLSNYSFDYFTEKSSKTALIKKLILLDANKSEMIHAKRALDLASAVNFTRDLVNGNADDVYADTLVEKAKELAKEHKSIQTTILDKKILEKEGFGLLLAVNQGADHDPALIIMEYKGDPESKEQTALVGKAITFDTGGLNLKPTNYIEDMRGDMGGGAAVFGIIKAAATLGLKTNIVAVIPATENAIGASSYKPGDVYIGYGKKSVEIGNTDAEGRLVLADAIAYVIDKYQPKRVIDFATLTGAIVVALGEKASGLFCNDENLSSSLVAAGTASHERLWPMPIFDDYKEQIKSKIADIKNTGGRDGGSITAALFLEAFVGKTPWAHIDIAGTATTTKPKGYNPTFATGVGVRLMVEFFENEK